MLEVVPSSFLRRIFFTPTCKAAVRTCYVRFHSFRTFYILLLLAELSERECVGAAGVHLLGLVHGLPPVEVGDVVLEDPALLLDALFLVRYADLHVVELRVQLQQSGQKY